MAKELTELEKYYNKFNEEKRLESRHGQVEFITSMKYIHNCLADMPDARILDVGAGTGKYSVALADEGYDVTAVELVKYNLGILKAKKSSVKAYQGNALHLKRFEDNSFDMTLLFGPMYHLYTFEDKLQALCEAKRVTKQGGVILVAYCMNEYCVLTYAFKENHIKECMEEQRLTGDFHSVAEEKHLYDYVRIEDINRLNGAAGLERIQIISPDGPADYMRPVLNAMDEETFQLFIRYHLATCERQDLIGAGAHTLDILRKPEQQS
jgi:ubiquinone/menaquinone biosynthesis C-methylase UbiE